MEYTLWNVILLNIPLVLAEYVCCMILDPGTDKMQAPGEGGGADAASLQPSADSALVCVLSA